MDERSIFHPQNNPNPFTRALEPRACHVCGYTLPAESYPLPYGSSDGHLIIPGTCLACKAHAQRQRRAAARGVPA